MKLSGMGANEIKENVGGGEFKYDYIQCIVRTFVNATKYPQHNNKKNQI
jgi:hypothetical protein